MGAQGPEMAAAHLDDDASTDPFALLEGKVSCHTGWLTLFTYGILNF